MSIEVKNISYTYGKNTPFEKKAVNNISFKINDGELIGLIGHTGSGKSTLIQLISGLIKPDCGQILIDNIDITSDKTKLREVRKKIGIVFQYPEHQLFGETVYKDIVYGPENYGLSETEISDIVPKVLDMVGLDESVLNKSPFELSGGQKRRVSIAGVLAMSPKILILDEPTAGLDPKGKRDILSTVKKLYNSEKMTVILVSHSMEDIADTVNKIMIVSDSELIKFDTLHNVFSNPEMLKKIDLNVPQVTRIINHLRRMGLDIKGDIYTVDSAVEAIMQYIKGGYK